MEGIPIKFRAKDNAGKLVYGDVIHYPDGNIGICLSYGSVPVLIDRDSVAQLVGYDAAGDEVYEGDELNCYDWFGAPADILRTKTPESVVKVWLEAHIYIPFREDGGRLIAAEDLNYPWHYEFLKKSAD